MTDRMTKTNTPFPDEDRELIERLRQGGRADRSGYRYDNLPINPDGPAAADRLESLLSDRAKLEEALEPFAKLGRLLDGPFAPALFSDDKAVGIGGAWSENGEPRTITFGDLRRATAALNKSTDRAT